MLQAHLNNEIYVNHGQLLCASYHHWTGKPLLTIQAEPDKLIMELYAASFAIVSHGIEDDPVFNFGNKVALELFELNWEDFIQLPSRNSVEMTNIKQREELMQRVTKDGHMSDYSGVRISSTGKRFNIEGATIWNIIDATGHYHGQAAMFKNWSFINYEQNYTFNN
ncbi:MAG: MEKHLA domain-containing protein [marine bacterium B5-7]|nr:MAG: MEKHLA domain-containing protein [marine bacterium B5-7]